MKDWRAPRRLGKTDLAVTGLCVGGSPLGSVPATYGYGVDEDQAVETVVATFSSDINFLDTANNYGENGSSERRIGAALKKAGFGPAALSLRPR